MEGRVFMTVQQLWVQSTTCYVGVPVVCLEITVKLTKTAVQILLASQVWTINSIWKNNVRALSKVFKIDQDPDFDIYFRSNMHRCAFHSTDYIPRWVQMRPLSRRLSGRRKDLPRWDMLKLESHSQMLFKRNIRMNKMNDSRLCPKKSDRTRILLGRKPCKVPQS